jgi:hypothetical protein
MGPKKGAKASKKAPDHGAEADPAELLSLIKETGNLPVENRLQLLHCSPNSCPAGCKGGRKENTACLCCLIPEEGRFKKTGLFQKLPAALGELGIDPSTQRRPVCCALRAARGTPYAGNRPLLAPRACKLRAILSVHEAAPRRPQKAAAAGFPARDF